VAAWGIVAVVGLLSMVPAVAGPPDSVERADAGGKTAAPVLQSLKAPVGGRRLGPDVDAWILPARRQVILDGVVCLREGALEMFACTRGTKEHESVVSIRVKAYMVHAALLAVGAVPGHPAEFTPSYRPASGTSVQITVQWIDATGKHHRADAQQWVRNVRTGKAMSHRWVFAGSGFWTDPQTGQKYYQAEGGDFICVSNFPSAMLDLPIESSQANAELLFAAFTEHIPPLGTPVRLVLTPVLPPPAPSRRGGRERGRKAPPAATPAVPRK